MAAACLGALVLGTGGAVVGLALAPQPVPRSLAPGPAVTSVPVTYETFDDARQTPFTLVSGASEEIQLHRAGTITSLTCEDGGRVASGDVPLSVDSSPVAALHTSYPLWRDLVPGDKGPDVAAVRSELTRLGYRAGAGDTVDRATQKALTAFFTDRGHARWDGSLPRGAVLWLPTPDLVVTECVLGPADPVAAGDTVMTSGGGLVALRPAQPPEGLVPGARAVAFADSTAPVAPDGVVTDPAFLAVVSGSPEYTSVTSRAADEGTAAQMTFTTALATPLTAAVLPAGSLFGVAGTSGCISSGGTTHPVTIVASMLGSTYVTLDDGSTPTTVDLHPPDDRTRRAGACS